MKSFRLDTSKQELLESWPAILLATCVCGISLYFGWFNVVGRILFIVIGASYFGFVSRGFFASRIEAQYPNARHRWLVSVGLTSAALGVFVRMLMPKLQGGPVDYVWLSLSFFTILAFVLLNRRDPDVLH